MKFITDNPNKPWDWNAISMNFNITMKNINDNDNPNKPWDWDKISMNPNITMKNINEYVIEHIVNNSWLSCNISLNKFGWLNKNNLLIYYRKMFDL